jgi:hypothetical protein
VTIDGLTKEAYFILYKERSNTKDISYAFSKEIVKHHKTLKEIIINKDKLFTSKY